MAVYTQPFFQAKPLCDWFVRVLGDIKTCFFFTSFSEEDSLRIRIQKEWGARPALKTAGSG